MEAKKNENYTVGVLALQGAFEEHQSCMEKLGCTTKQIKTPSELLSPDIDGLILPGGESTAMGLIGNGEMWETLQKVIIQNGMPTWGTCAGMILLAERCVGTSAVIENGQSLIGGMDILVCRNYFGSQISSFEMATPPPPHLNNQESFPGVFIRAPAILSINNPEDKDMKILGKVVATPCRQASVVLQELEKKIKNGENVIKMGVVDALVREEKNESVVRMKETSYGENADKEVINNSQEEKKDDSTLTDMKDEEKIVLPGAAKDTNAREVICAVQKKNILCTAFHPEITEDLRWHQYFLEQIIMKK